MAPILQQYFQIRCFEKVAKFYQSASLQPVIMLGYLTRGLNPTTAQNHVIHYGVRMLIFWWITTSKCLVFRRDSVERKKVKDLQPGLTDLLSKAGLTD